MEYKNLDSQLYITNSVPNHILSCLIENKKDNLIIYEKIGNSYYLKISDSYVKFQYPSPGNTGGIGSTGNTGSTGGTGSGLQGPKGATGGTGASSSHIYSKIKLYEDDSIIKYTYPRYYFDSIINCYPYNFFKKNPDNPDCNNRIYPDPLIELDDDTKPIVIPNPTNSLDIILEAVSCPDDINNTNKYKLNLYSKHIIAVTKEYIILNSHELKYNSLLRNNNINAISNIYLKITNIIDYVKDKYKIFIYKKNYSFLRLGKNIVLNPQYINNPKDDIAIHDQSNSTPIKIKINIQNCIPNLNNYKTLKIFKYIDINGNDITNTITRVDTDLENIYLTQSYNNTVPEANSGYLIYELSNSYNNTITNHDDLNIDLQEYIKLDKIIFNFLYNRQTNLFFTHGLKQHPIISKYYNKDGISIKSIKVIPRFASPYHYNEFLQNWCYMRSNLDTLVDINLADYNDQPHNNEYIEAKKKFKNYQKTKTKYLSCPNAGIQNIFFPVNTYQIYKEPLKTPVLYFKSESINNYTDNKVQFNFPKYFLIYKKNFRKFYSIDPRVDLNCDYSYIFYDYRFSEDENSIEFIFYTGVYVLPFTTYTTGIVTLEYDCSSIPPLKIKNDNKSKDLLDQIFLFKSNKDYLNLNILTQILEYDKDNFPKEYEGPLWKEEDFDLVKYKLDLLKNKFNIDDDNIKTILDNSIKEYNKTRKYFKAYIPDFINLNNPSRLSCNVTRKSVCDPRSVQHIKEYHEEIYDIYPIAYRFLDNGDVQDIILYNLDEFDLMINNKLYPPNKVKDIQARLINDVNYYNMLSKTNVYDLVLKQSDLPGNKKYYEIDLPENYEIDDPNDISIDGYYYDEKYNKVYIKPDIIDFIDNKRISISFRQYSKLVNHHFIDNYNKFNALDHYKWLAYLNSPFHDKIYNYINRATDLTLFSLFHTKDIFNLPIEYYSTDKKYYPENRPDIGSNLERYNGIKYIGPTDYYHGYNLLKIHSPTDENILKNIFKIFTKYDYKSYLRAGTGFHPHITNLDYYNQVIKMFLNNHYRQSTLDPARYDITSFDEKARCFEYPKQSIEVVADHTCKYDSSKKTWIYPKINSVKYFEDDYENPKFRTPNAKLNKSYQYYEFICRKRYTNPNKEKPYFVTLTYKILNDLVTKTKFSGGILLDTFYLDDNNLNRNLFLEIRLGLFNNKLKYRYSCKYPTKAKRHIDPCSESPGSYYKLYDYETYNIDARSKQIYTRANYNDVNLKYYYSWDPNISNKYNTSCKADFSGKDNWHNYDEKNNLNCDYRVYPENYQNIFSHLHRGGWFCKVNNFKYPGDPDPDLFIPIEIGVIDTWYNDTLPNSLRSSNKITYLKPLWGDLTRNTKTNIISLREVDNYQYSHRDYRHYHGEGNNRYLVEHCTASDSWDFRPIFLNKSEKLLDYDTRFNKKSTFPTGSIGLGADQLEDINIQYCEYINKLYTACTDVANICNYDTVTKQYYRHNLYKLTYRLPIDLKYKIFSTKVNNYSYNIKIYLPGFYYRRDLNVTSSYSKNTKTWHYYTRYKYDNYNKFKINNNTYYWSNNTLWQVLCEVYQEPLTLDINFTIDKSLIDTMFNVSRDKDHLEYVSRYGFFTKFDGNTTNLPNIFNNILDPLRCLKYIPKYPINLYNYEYFMNNYIDSHLTDRTNCSYINGNIYRYCCSHEYVCISPCKEVKSQKSCKITGKKDYIIDQKNCMFIFMDDPNDIDQLNEYTTSVINKAKLSDNNRTVTYCIDYSKSIVSYCDCSSDKLDNSIVISENQIALYDDQDQLLFYRDINTKYCSFEELILDYQKNNLTYDPNIIYLFNFNSRYPDLTDLAIKANFYDWPADILIDFKFLNKLNNLNDRDLLLAYFIKYAEFGVYLNTRDKLSHIPLCYNLDQDQTKLQYKCLELTDLNDLTNIVNYDINNNYYSVITDELLPKYGPRKEPACVDSDVTKNGWFSFKRILKYPIFLRVIFHNRNQEYYLNKYLTYLKLHNNLHVYQISNYNRCMTELKHNNGLEINPGDYVLEYYSKNGNLIPSDTYTVYYKNNNIEIVDNTISLETETRSFKYDKKSYSYDISHAKLDIDFNSILLDPKYLGYVLLYKRKEFNFSSTGGTGGVGKLSSEEYKSLTGATGHTGSTGGTGVTGGTGEVGLTGYTGNTGGTGGCLYRLYFKEAKYNTLQYYQDQLENNSDITDIEDINEFFNIPGIKNSNAQEGIPATLDPEDQEIVQKQCFDKKKEKDNKIRLNLEKCKFELLEKNPELEYTYIKHLTGGTGESGKLTKLRDIYKTYTGGTGAFSLKKYRDPKTLEIKYKPVGTGSTGGLGKIYYWQDDLYTGGTGGANINQSNSGGIGSTGGTGEFNNIAPSGGTGGTGKTGGTGYFGFTGGTGEIGQEFLNLCNIGSCSDCNKVSNINWCKRPNRYLYALDYRSHINKFLLTYTIDYKLLNPNTEYVLSCTDRQDSYKYVTKREPLPFKVQEFLLNILNKNNMYLEDPNNPYHYRLITKPEVSQFNINILDIFNQKSYDSPLKLINNKLNDNYRNLQISLDQIFNTNYYYNQKTLKALDIEKVLLVSSLKNPLGNNDPYELYKDYIYKYSFNINTTSNTLDINLLDNNLTFFDYLEHQICDEDLIHIHYDYVDYNNIHHDFVFSFDHIDIHKFGTLKVLFNLITC